MTEETDLSGVWGRRGRQILPPRRHMVHKVPQRPRRDCHALGGARIAVARVFAGADSDLRQVVTEPQPAAALRCCRGHERLRQTIAAVSRVANWSWSPGAISPPRGLLQVSFRAAGCI